MKSLKSICISLLFGCLFAQSCSKDTTVPVSDQLKKIWSATVVRESSTTVYTKGAIVNVKPGYGQFQLDLRSATSASLTDLDGITFVGQWSLSSDEKTLTLSGLNPQPYGTGGKITYTINSISESALSLTRTEGSPKTGGTINEYQLSNP